MVNEKHVDDMELEDILDVVGFYDDADAKIAQFNNMLKETGGKITYEAVMALDKREGGENDL